MARIMDSDEIRKYITTFSTKQFKYGSQGFKRVLLQLFGFAGDGKSSLINSCLTTLSERKYKQYATTEQSHKPETLNRTLYTVNDTISIVDNRGYLRMGKLETGEIFAQLANLVPLNQKVEWPENFLEIMNRMVAADMDSNFSDLIIPVFVYSTRRKLLEEDIQNIKTFIRICRMITGVAPTIVLTHKTDGDIHNMEKAFRRMGADEIYKLENYTDRDHNRERAKEEEILRFLYGAIQDGTFYIEGGDRDPRRERSESITFLQKYFHEQEIARKEHIRMITTQKIKGYMKDM